MLAMADFCRGPDDNEPGNSPGNVAGSLLPQSRNRFNLSLKTLFCFRHS
jgi:hypothetical protein